MGLRTYSVLILPTLQIVCVFSQRGNIVHGGTIYFKIIECLLPFIMTFVLPRLSIYCISSFFICLFLLWLIQKPKSTHQDLSTGPDKMHPAFLMPSLIKVAGKGLVDPLKLYATHQSVYTGPDIRTYPPFGPCTYLFWFLFWVPLHFIFFGCW